MKHFAKLLALSVLGALLASQAGCKSGDKKTTIAMLPKSRGNAYFIACEKGAREAEQELKVKLLWDGPSSPDASKQNELVETWITRGVDAIAVSVESPDAIATALRKARGKGIKVITWDSDCPADARDFFVNQVTVAGVGQTLTDNAAKIMGGKGEFAIIKASVTAANMIAWQKEIEKRLEEKYPDMKLVAVEPCDDKQPVAHDKAVAILNAHKDVKLIMAICSPAVPGAASAVKELGRDDVKVIGLGLPNENRSYVKEGITDSVTLWNTADLGYLTVYAAKSALDGTLKSGATKFAAGRLGEREVAGDNILLGLPFTFTKDNIDNFDF